MEVVSTNVHHGDRTGRAAHCNQFMHVIFAVTDNSENYLTAKISQYTASFLNMVQPCLWIFQSYVCAFVFNSKQ